MDRTGEFAAAAAEARPEPMSDTVARVNIPASPFVIRASLLLNQIISFETLLARTADSFIDYHRFHPSKFRFQGSSSDMTEAERAEFTQEIALFVTAFAAEVRELRRSIAAPPILDKEDKKDEKSKNSGIKSSSSQEEKKSSVEEMSHREDVVSYLLERLSVFTKTSQRLQNERLKYSINPLSLFTNTSNTTIKKEFKEQEKQEKIKIKDIDHKKSRGEISDLMNKLHEDDEEETRKEQLAARTKLPVLTPLTQSFVDRYESEIAPPKVLKEYETLGLKHKKILLKESKVLQHQYSEELLETTKMEKSVIKISNLLFDFVNILQSQRGLVDDVNNCGKVTIDYVKDTDSELFLTIQRSESHQKSMVFLTVGLALVLLLLDFVTP